MGEPGSIAFLGFGEAARAFHATLRVARPGIGFAAFDRKLATDPVMRRAMTDAGVLVCETAAALAGADWIVSAVTADQSLLAVEALLPALTGGLVIDVNSVSPGRKRDTAARVVARGAQYLDMAVMTPVHPRGHASPVLVAGPEAAGLLSVLAAMGFDAEVAGDAAGEATAIKMVRSVFVKGLEAITVETLLAAEASGCLPRILDSLDRSYPGLNLPEKALYQFERTLTHGARRAAEMRESAVTVDELGLTGALAAATAEVQDRQAAAGPMPVGDLAQVVADVLRRRLATSAD